MVLLHKLQRSQGMGEQSQVMALQCWQQGGVEMVDLVGAERVHP